MTEMEKSSLFYRVLHGNKLIPEVKKITEPKGTTAKTDTTTQDNPYGIKSQDAGWKSVGDMTLTIGDTGSSLYSDLLTLWKNGTKEIWEIAYAPVGSGRAIVFNGFISGVGHSHADDGGPQTIEVTVTLTSDFTPLSSGSVGLSALVVTDDDGHALTLTPSVAGTTYDYECTAYSSGTENNNSDTVTVTVTSAAGSIYVNGVLTATTVASAAIPISQTQGDITMIGVACCTKDTASKTYLIRVKMGNAAYVAP